MIIVYTLVYLKHILECLGCTPLINTGFKDAKAN